MSGILQKIEFLGLIFEVQVSFQVKNKDEGVSLRRLGKIGKIETFENV